MQDAVKNMSVKNLKNTIEQVGLESEGIVDKQDLIELAREALKINDATAAAAAEAPKPTNAAAAAATATTAPAVAAQVEPTPVEMEMEMEMSSEERDVFVSRDPAPGSGCRSKLHHQKCTEGCESEASSAICRRWKAVDAGSTS
jgi:hypothetical protein